MAEETGRHPRSHRRVAELCRRGQAGQPLIGDHRPALEAAALFGMPTVALSAVASVGPDDAFARRL